jgi:hypothetical protein
LLNLQFTDTGSAILHDYIPIPLEDNEVAQCGAGSKLDTDSTGTTNTGLAIVPTKLAISTARF